MNYVTRYAIWTYEILNIDGKEYMRVLYSMISMIKHLRRFDNCLDVIFNELTSSIRVFI